MDSDWVFNFNCSQKPLNSSKYYDEQIIPSPFYDTVINRNKPGLINQLDKFRKKRNIGGYEAAGRISQQEADEMKKLAKNLCEQIVQWLHQNHANLMK